MFFIVISTKKLFHRKQSYRHTLRILTKFTDCAKINILIFFSEVDFMRIKDKINLDRAWLEKYGPINIVAFGKPN